MKRVSLILFITGLLLCLSCNEQNTTDQRENLVDFVDPFIGTGGHGHTYPGATSPFGMVQPSPDNGTGGWDWCSGYHISDSIISGFGQLHLSGTGIGDLADLILMPTNAKLDVSLFGKTRDSLPYPSHFSHATELASPGYYKVQLEDPNIQVELTANDYVSFHKYTYTKEQEPSFILDPGYQVNWDKLTESAIYWDDDSNLTGYRT